MSLSELMKIIGPFRYSYKTMMVPPEPPIHDGEFVDIEYIKEAWNRMCTPGTEIKEI